jgi:hypothetical protein
MLANHAGLEMLDGGVNEIFRIEKILEDSPDVLCLHLAEISTAIFRTFAKYGSLRRVCGS